MKEKVKVGCIQWKKYFSNLIENSKCTFYFQNQFYTATFHQAAQSHYES